MSALKDIRRRLRSVENIKKITDAMEKIAFVQLRKAQMQAELPRPYIIKMRELVAKLQAAEAAHPLLEKRTVQKTGVIVIASDKGLSGAYNTNIFQVADNFLKNYVPEQIELMLFGRKAYSHYKKRKWPIRSYFNNWSGKITKEEVQKFTQQLLDWFLIGDLDEIWLIYTNFISIVNKKIVVEKFMNVAESKEKRKSMNYIFEPSAEAILADLLPRFSFVHIQSALNEAYASELAARVVAMQIASKNSDDLIDRLTLVRNKVRQESITKEMLEISAVQS